MNFEVEIKDRSNRFNKNDSTLSERSFLDGLPQLLEVLAEPDGKIRDELGWTTLSQSFWIHKIADEIPDEHP